MPSSNTVTNITLKLCPKSGTGSSQGHVFVALMFPLHIEMEVYFDQIMRNTMIFSLHASIFHNSNPVQLMDHSGGSYLLNKYGLKSINATWSYLTGMSYYINKSINKAASQFAFAESLETTT